ncbi:MAG: HNH endonuclease [Chloroflexota bacterium]|nr:HNH endonuclease [Chloroflexota bacterium]
MVRTIPTDLAVANPDNDNKHVSSSRNLLSSSVLVLNLNYVPINISTGRRALILVEKGKAESLDNQSGSIRTVDQVLNVPSIIRLSYMVKRPYAPRKISKKEIFFRDQHTCQYCSKKTPDLTLDHVIPRIQKGPHTWENVVAACSKCNLHKAGRTPSEANMHLLREPRIPQPNPYRILQNYSILDEWLPYVPWSMKKQGEAIEG